MHDRMGKSLDSHRPNFQKDVIYPQIYDLQNIKLIHSCNYPQTPKNNVMEIKKKNIQNVIKSIIHKPQIPIHQSDKQKKGYLQRTKQTSKIHKVYYRQTMNTFKEQKLFMQIDEHLGEMMALMEQNFAPFADRVKSILKKVHYHSVNQKQKDKKREVQKYVKVICGEIGKIKIDPKNFKNIDGMLDELDQIEKRGYSPKKRVQSAKLLKNSSLGSMRSNKLSQSKLFNRSTTNIKKTEGLQAEKIKSKKLIEMINDCLQSQGKNKKQFQKQIFHMKEEWGATGNLKQTLINSKNLVLNKTTFDLLQQKRLKSIALSAIDNQYLKRQ